MTKNDNNMDPHPLVCHIPIYRLFSAARTFDYQRVSIGFKHLYRTAVFSHCWCKPNLTEKDTPVLGMFNPLFNRSPKNEHHEVAQHNRHNHRRLSRKCTAQIQPTGWAHKLPNPMHNSSSKSSFWGMYAMYVKLKQTTWPQLKVSKPELWRSLTEPHLCSTPLNVVFSSWTEPRWSARDLRHLPGCWSHQNKWIPPR